MIANALAFVTGQWERLIIYGLTALLILGAAWTHGYVKGSAKLADYKVAQAREAVRIVVKQGAVTTRTLTRYVKVKAKTEAATSAVAKEVSDYEKINPGLCLDPDWRRVHDAAAVGPVPGTAAGTDGKGRTPATAAGAGTSTAPEAGLALATVTANYAACHRTADRLDALQEWIREQGRVK